MIKTTIKTQPATEPVTLDELKAQMIIEHDLDNTIIQSYGKGARIWLERYLAIKFITTEIEQVFDDVHRVNHLAYGPLIDVTKIEYYDNGYKELNVTPLIDTYSTPPRIMIHPDDTLPATDAVINRIRVTYTAGFGPTAADVPQVVKDAILLRAAGAYEKRADYAKKYNDASISLVRSYKNYL